MNAHERGTGEYTAPMGTPPGGAGTGAAAPGTAVDARRVARLRPVGDVLTAGGLPDPEPCTGEVRVRLAPPTFLWRSRRRMVAASAGTCQCGAR